MTLRKRFLLLLVTCCIPLYWAVPAAAQITLPPVPIPPDSDAWLSLNPNGQFVGPFGFTETEEEPNGFFANIGIPTTSATGTAIQLREKNPTPSSDYVYAVAGFLYISSDSQNGNIQFHPLFPNGAANLNVVASLDQTGQWQEITQYFAGTPRTWVASDAEVPEPATVSGLALASALVLLVRRRRT
jgi:hypothetical protein